MSTIETYESEKVEGLIAEISYDESAGSDNPRDWDNCWTILTNQSRYADIDGTLDPDECMVHCETCDGSGEQEVDEEEREQESSVFQIRGADCPDCDGLGERNDIDAYLRANYDAHLIVPVYKYEHGLVTYQAGTSGNPFSCPWDSGMVGVAVLDKATLDKEWNDHADEDGVMRDQLWWALKYLDGELETYTDWCNGSVYSVVCETEDGEFIDSCGGIYGFDYAGEMAKEMLEGAEEDAAEEAKTAHEWAERDVVTV